MSKNDVDEFKSRQGFADGAVGFLHKVTFRYEGGSGS
jgi:hypothetical protein